MKLQTVETVTITQAKDTIAQAARIYFARDRQGRYQISRRRARPICLMGPAGIGKTEVVRQVAQEQDLAFMDNELRRHGIKSFILSPQSHNICLPGTVSVHGIEVPHPFVHTRDSLLLSGGIV